MMYERKLSWTLIFIFPFISMSISNNCSKIWSNFAIISDRPSFYHINKRMLTFFKLASQKFTFAAGSRFPSSWQIRFNLVYVKLIIMEKWYHSLFTFIFISYFHFLFLNFTYKIAILFLIYFLFSNIYIENTKNKFFLFVLFPAQIFKKKNKLKIIWQFYN